VGVDRCGERGDRVGVANIQLRRHRVDFAAFLIYWYTACRARAWDSACSAYHYVYHRAVDNLYDNLNASAHHIVHDYLHNVYCPDHDGTCDHDYDGCPYNHLATDHDDNAA
jgi:hypothetical protein